jgi:sigma-B regulation protein RsbU (phosphoserine phosphatase)
MRILVAEDDRITRISLQRQLEGWGHAVTAVEDGQVAWEQFQTAEFDIVLTDWEMPRLSGVELIQQIRQATNAGFVYIIMLTSRSDKADIVRGIEAGADDFVAKPFDKQELRVRLLAGERIVRLERTLSAQNAELRAASQKMQRDLLAAARVQRSMLPQHDVVTPRVRTAWKYVPTDELAGDAIGLHLVEDRYLVSYVIDVSGHGVPAALLSVTAMHQLAPQPEATSLLRDLSASGDLGTMQQPAHIATQMNRRFCASDNDGLFLTMILCILDTHTGRLHFTSAGHPPPLLLRGQTVVPLPEAGGFPLAIEDQAQYEQVAVDLQPGDRIYLLSDGIIEQHDPQDTDEFGLKRLTPLIASLHTQPVNDIVARVVEELSQWAGKTSFKDDVSLVVLEWLGS